MRKLVPLFILLGLCVSLDAGIPGDIDADGFVGLQDVRFIAEQWLGVPGDPNADIAPLPDGDGTVNVLDFAVVADHWLLADPDPNEMIFISGGQFQMGDSFAEGNFDEFPLHAVTIDAVYMGKYEITNAQYCTFLNSMFDSNSVYLSANMVYGTDNDQIYCDTSASNASSQIAYAGGAFTVQMKGDRDMLDDPMVRVTWYGSAAYCNWRSQQEGYESCYDLLTWFCDFSKSGYHLPTEAQWEYAARGGFPDRRFSWDDPNTISHSLANYRSAWELGVPYYPYDVSPTEADHPDWDDGIDPHTAPVGSFAPNGFGLYDMTGNVWEWCNDWYDEDYYNVSPASNPTGPISSPYSVRVHRGGSWDYNAELCRVSCRSTKAPANRYGGSGFRVCRNLN